MEMAVSKLVMPVRRQMFSVSSILDLQEPLELELLDHAVLKPEIHCLHTRAG